jgi:hypothetical protein
MKPVEMLRQGWWTICVVGVLVGKLFPASAVAAVVLLGLILLVHAADVRYPGVAWPAVIGRFHRDYRLDPAWGIIGATFALAGLGMIADGNPSGMFAVLCVADGVITLAAPRPTPVPVTE